MTKKLPLTQVSGWQSWLEIIWLILVTDFYIIRMQKEIVDAFI